MKNSVSKILPTSLSKWLSPKVDANSGRRRRHEELESDDDEVNRNASSATATTVGSRYNAYTSQSTAPPSKKQKTFSVNIVFPF